MARGEQATDNDAWMKSHTFILIDGTGTPELVWRDGRRGQRDGDLLRGESVGSTQ